jgi:hypothetical protein
MDMKQGPTRIARRVQEMYEAAEAREKGRGEKLVALTSMVYLAAQLSKRCSDEKEKELLDRQIAQAGLSLQVVLGLNYEELAGMIKAVKLDSRDFEAAEGKTQ